MKRKLLLLLALFTLLVSNAQSKYGASVSYSAENTVGFDFFLIKGENRFHLGFGYEFGKQKKNIVSERKSNYGLTKIEDGKYLWLIDFGYSRFITKKLSVNPELSFGKLTEFTNFKDNRFSDGGYSLINNTESKIGFGVNVGYLATANFEPFIGFGTF
jgi:hypothetical protein